MKFTVLVTDRVSPVGLHPLLGDDRFEVITIDDSMTPEFGEALDRADALIVRSATTVNAETLLRAPALKVVGRAGVGVDNIDIEAATSRGVLVFNAPDASTVAAAELTMALMLAMARKVTEADRSVREGRWERSRFHGSELRGKTLGLIGAGRIGGEVAVLSRAFGMTVIASDPYLTTERGASLGIELVELDRVVATSDVISVHVPLNEETEGLIGAELLARVKPTSCLINASRGGVVDEEALAAALHSGSLAGAALDVFATEPLPDDSPLRTAPNLIFTPHLGASTAEAQVAVARDVAVAIRTALVDGDITGAVNAGALESARS